MAAIRGGWKLLPRIYCAFGQAGMASRYDAGGNTSCTLHHADNVLNVRVASAVLGDLLLRVSDIFFSAEAHWQIYCIILSGGGLNVWRRCFIEGCSLRCTQFPR